MATSNPVRGIQDIQETLIAYAKQETVQPLKTLGRYLGFGVAGSLFVFLGFFFVMLATLRLLQSLDVFAGSSWASLGPYGIAIAVLVLAMLIIYSALSRARKKVFK